MRQFGGHWTEQKLESLYKYLVAYTKIMSKQPFRYAYIDAFAGTGYRHIKQENAKTLPMFPEIMADEPQGFLEGSAKIALQVEPPFTKYIFIEKSEKRCEQLAALREGYPELADRISIINADCNAYLQDLCLNYSWSKNRAVLFLDPFGMQVDWDTMRAVAETKAIDVWILFPLGVAVNRLLKKDGNIENTWRKRLDRLFGTQEWYDRFYKEVIFKGLLGEEKRTIKTCTFESISQYYVERLQAIFTEVADNPKPLCNSKGNPLFHLCFAAGNLKGAKIAVKIAKFILEG